MSKRTFIAVGAVAGALLFPSLARAQSAGPHKHDPARHPKVDLDEKIPLEGGKTATRRMILSHIDPKAMVDLHNGQKTTVAEFFGHLRDIEDRHGQPLHSIPAQAHVHPGSAQALEAQRRVHADHVAQLRRAEEQHWSDVIRRRTTPQPGAPQAARAPSMQTLTAGWQKEFGHEDTLAAYGSFSVAVEAPNSKSATCVASLDFGGYLLKHHQSLAKAQFQEQALPGSATGSVAVYVLGKAASVYKRDFHVGKEAPPRWSHTWMTPELNHEFGPFWGVITFQVKAKGSAGFDLTASNELDPQADSTGCSADFTPSANAKAIVDLGVKVGIPKLQHLVRVGVKGDVTIAKVTTPANAGMRVDQKQGTSLNERVKASVSANFLAGELVFEVDLANPCIHIPFFGKHCLLGLFHVKSHYEYTFHKWGGFAYDHVLLDASRTQEIAGPPASPSASASASASAPPKPPSPPSAGPACTFDSSKPFGIKACDDYVATANKCAASAGANAAQVRAETNATRARFESMMCQDGGPTKLPDICDEALRFLKRTCS